MKKIITLVLALALVLTSVVAIAEAVEAPAAPKGTPNINSFATMKVVYHGAKFNNRQNWNVAENCYEITLSKPVDRLLICWAEKGAEPEELAVGEDLKATALAWNHKYMPGTKQVYVTSLNGKTLNNKNTTNINATVAGYDVVTSETVYKESLSTSPYYAGANTVAFQYETTFPTIELDGEMEDKGIRSINAQIADYQKKWVSSKGYTIVKPVKVTNPVTGKTEWTKGYIVANPVVTPGINPKTIQTVIATPADTAFMTVQGEWAVYYNRAGKIVGIELFDGQF